MLYNSSAELEQGRTCLWYSVCLWPAAESEQGAYAIPQPQHANTLVDVQPSANTPPTPKSASQVSILRRPLGSPAVRHALQQQCRAGARSHLPLVQCVGSSQPLSLSMAAYACLQPQHAKHVCGCAVLRQYPPHPQIRLPGEHFEEAPWFACCEACSTTAVPSWSKVALASGTVCRL